MEFSWYKIVLGGKYINKLILLIYYTKLRIVISVEFRRNCFQYWFYFRKEVISIKVLDQNYLWPTKMPMRLIH